MMLYRKIFVLILFVRGCVVFVVCAAAENAA